jgi:hypothetical protein
MACPYRWVLVSFGMGAVWMPRSFPRKRESNPCASCSGERRSPEGRTPFGPTILVSSQHNRRMKARSTCFLGSVAWWQLTLLGQGRRLVVESFRPIRNTITTFLFNYITGLKA